jgi:kynurenine formamidase
MAELEAREDNWGRWGAEDERGALNLLTPGVILRALGHVRHGRVYSLGLPIAQESTPAFGHRNPPLRLTLRNGHENGRFGFGPSAEQVGSAEDYLVMSSHSGTHMDALIHTWYGNQIYNGYPDDVIKTWQGATRCGIDKAGWVVTRGVLLDLPAHHGRPYLDPPHIITSAELADCAAAQGVELRSGDALLVRTGRTRVMREAPERWAGGQPGLGLDATRLIRERDIAVVGADNSAVECLPFDQGEFIGVHRELLWKLGVPLIELMDLEALAADRVYEFLFVAAPLKVAGGMGSPLNPLAIA